LYHFCSDTDPHITEVDLVTEKGVMIDIEEEESRNATSQVTNTKIGRIALGQAIVIEQIEKVVPVREKVVLVIKRREITMVQIKVMRRRTMIRAVRVTVTDMGQGVEARIESGGRRSGPNTGAETGGRVDRRVGRENASTGPGVAAVIAAKRGTLGEREFDN